MRELVGIHGDLKLGVGTEWSGYGLFDRYGSKMG